MRTTRFGFYLIALISLVFNACEDKNCDVTGEVELFLLESYDTNGFCEIVKSSVETGKKPLIEYSDFKSYNAKHFVFKITDKAKETIEGLEHPVNGLPFVVAADDQLIYTGYFWPAYSSASCQWLVIDPLMMRGDNELWVELGYPGPIEGTEIPDDRNNSLILDIFRRDGKLIE